MASGSFFRVGGGTLTSVHGFVFAFGVEAGVLFFEGFQGLFGVVGVVGGREAEEGALVCV